MAKYTRLGLTGLILGIIALCSCWIPILIPYGAWRFLFFYSAYILGVISITFGAVAILGKRKDILGLFGVTFGCLAIALGTIFVEIVSLSGLRVC